MFAYKRSDWDKFSPFPPNKRYVLNVFSSQNGNFWIVFVLLVPCILYDKCT